MMKDPLLTGMEIRVISLWRNDRCPPVPPMSMSMWADIADIADGVDT